VESFRDTLREAAAAREALPDGAETVTVLNKADAVDPATLRDRRAAVSQLAPEPVAISAREDDRDALAGLVDRLLGALPSLEQAELTLPVTDARMSLVSWLHDEATTVEAEYDADSVTLAVEADPATMARARHRAEGLEGSAPRGR